MNLTRHEFYERCFVAIDEDSVVSQTAMLIALYWNAEGDTERWGLFETTCFACRTTPRAITILALKSRIHNGR